MKQVFVSYSFVVMVSVTGELKQDFDNVLLDMFEVNSNKEFLDTLTNLVDDYAKKRYNKEDCWCTILYFKIMDI